MSGVPFSTVLSTEVFNALDDLAKRRGVSLDAALAMAVSHDKYFQDAVDDGYKVLTEDPRTRKMSMVLLAPSARRKAS